MCEIGENTVICGKYYPYTMLATRAVPIIDDNSLMYFRKILQLRQKQLTFDNLLFKKARKAIAEYEKSTASKRQSRGKAPRGELPSLSMEGVSHSKK